MLPLSSFVESPLFNLNTPHIPLLTASILDITAYPEAMELLISYEILTLPTMFYLPLLPVNDSNHPIFLPNLEAQLNNNQLPTVYEPALIVVYSQLLT